MDVSAWGSLLDENVDRRVATRLEEHGHRAVMVVDALEPGADDYDDVLQYARQEDRIVVTKDVSDFGKLDPDSHAGLILVFDDALGGDVMANGIRRIVDAYQSPDDLAGREALDDWV
jgi:hypothetical protein